MAGHDDEIHVGLIREIPYRVAHPAVEDLYVEILRRDVSNALSQPIHVFELTSSALLVPTLRCDTRVRDRGVGRKMGDDRWNMDVDQMEGRVVIGGKISGGRDRLLAEMGSIQWNENRPEHGPPFIQIRSRGPSVAVQSTAGGDRADSAFVADSTVSGESGYIEG